MEDPTSILWEMNFLLINQKSKSSTKGWTLRKGIKVFCNPEARCPNCEKWIPTNRIWIVDDSSNILMGCWYTNGSPVTKEIIHPHAAFGGSVCLGDNQQASSSLFAGINRGSHYYITEEWFTQLGHDCPNVEYLKCEGCQDSFYYIEQFSESRELCLDCEEDKARCDSCGEWVDRDTLVGDLCKSCHDNLYCSWCGQNRVESQEDYCEDCLCFNCGGVKDNSDKDLCYECGPYGCMNCDSGVKERNSLCQSCQEEEDERNKEDI